MKIATRQTRFQYVEPTSVQECALIMQALLSDMVDIHQQLNERCLEALRRYPSQELYLAWRRRAQSAQSCITQVYLRYRAWYNWRTQEVVA